MNISKKIIAAVLSAVICLSMAACGDSSSSSKDDTSSAAVSESETEKPAETEPEATTTEKPEETKPAETEPAETEAVTTTEKPEESEPEESEPEESEPEESEPEESEPEVSGDGQTLKGTGYQLQFPENWLEFKAYKDKANEAMKKEGKTAIMLQPFGSEYAYYYSGDLNIEDGVTYFYTVKPTTMSAYKGHSIAEDAFKNALAKTMESSFKTGKLESTTTVKVGGSDALRYEGTINNNNIEYKVVMYITINGSTLYQYAFASPTSDFSSVSGDLDAIMNSVKFTEA